MKRLLISVDTLLFVVAILVLCERSFGEDIIYKRKIPGAMTVTVEYKDNANLNRLSLRITPQEEGEPLYKVVRLGKMLELKEGKYMVRAEPRSDLPYISKSVALEIRGEEHTSVKLPVKQFETQSFTFLVTGPDGKPVPYATGMADHHKYPEWKYAIRANGDGQMTLQFPKEDGSVVRFWATKRRDVRTESVPLKDLLKGHDTGPIPHQLEAKIHTGTLQFRLKGKGMSCVEYFGDDVESFATVLVPAKPKNEKDKRMIWIPSDSLQVKLYDMKPGKYRVVSLSLDMSEYRYGITLYGKAHEVIEIDRDRKLIGGPENVIDLPGWPVFPAPMLKVYYSRGRYEGDKASLEMKVIGTAHEGLKAGQIIREELNFVKNGASVIKIPNGVYEMKILSPEGNVLRGPEHAVVNPRTVPTYEVLPRKPKKRAP